MITESVKAIFNMKGHLKLVEEYCRNDFNRSDLKRRHSSNGAWCTYRSFEVIDEKRINVLYDYGYEQYEYSSSYMIYLGYEYRDKAISDILSSEKP